MTVRPRAWRAATATAAALGLVGCGGSTPGTAPAHHHPPTTHAHTAPSGMLRRHHQPARMVALVTAQNENRVLMVALPTGRTLHQVTVTGDPGYIATAGPAGPYIVVSSAGRVTLLGGARLARQAVLGGFGSPHIPAIAPGGGWAYVTDDARGQLVTIGLTDQRVDARTFVGVGAHHLAVSPDGQRIWVALSQAASTITILSTLVARPLPPASPIIDPRRPRIIGHWQPGFLVHDLLFSPNGRQVWLTAANRTEVSVYRARDRHLLFRVPAGPPPQHIAFASASAYITSGYGGQIERVSMTSGHIIKRATTPVGSFDLDAAGPYVVTASLFKGTIAIYNHALRLLRVRRLAASAEDIALTNP